MLLAAEEGSQTMRIAVVDHVGNYGGGSRVVRSLLPALKHCDPSVTIEYFGNPGSIRRENLSAEFEQEGIRVSPLISLQLSSGALFGSPLIAKAIAMAQRRWSKNISWLPEAISGDVAGEIERRGRGFDLVFFPWPYMLRLPRLDCPVVGIFHDFNFKYYFSGSDTFSTAQRRQMEHEMPRWLERATPVVSTHFMASELRTFYPAAAQKARVIHLAPFGSPCLIEASRADIIVRSLGVTSPYLLYPTHLCSHKNVGPLIAALALLRHQGRKMHLVLTGAGTEIVRGHATSIGVRLDGANGDVLGLGYVSNLQMDALLQCAAVVVSPSLYEAGNGPGLDAWGRGTPVAMSDIPAFSEHLVYQDLRAKVFDPRNPQDIADKIAAIIDDPVQARKDVEHSLQALEKLTWAQTASQYMAVFQEALASQA